MRRCRVLPALLLLLLLADATSVVRSFYIQPGASSLVGQLSQRRFRGAACSTPSCALTAGRAQMAVEAGKKVKDLTLVFCRKVSSKDRKQILLGKKKRGFGAGKWNGFGGKVEDGETIETAAKRELLEESSIEAKQLSLRGILIFNVPSYTSTMMVYVYEAVGYSGVASESDEMQPQWFDEGQLPLKEMWADDEFWLPLFLEGKLFRGEFDFSDDDTIVRKTLREVPCTDPLLEYDDMTKVPYLQWQLPVDYCKRAQ